MVFVSSAAIFARQVFGHLAENEGFVPGKSVELCT
jgi:hypothetical protein